MKSQLIDGIHHRKTVPRMRSFGAFNSVLPRVVSNTYHKDACEEVRTENKVAMAKSEGYDFITKTVEVEHISADEKLAEDDVIDHNEKEISPVRDPKKRAFLQIATMAGVGMLLAAFIPRKAEALILGSSPTTGVVGVKDSTDSRINPATEETLQDLLSGQGVLKITTQLNASGNVLTPTAGKKIRVYSTRFSLTADVDSVSFRFTSGGSDYERYVSPKTGGLYGANNHPNFIEGGIDEAMYCAITGSATVQINVDYLEV